MGAQAIIAHIQLLRVTTLHLILQKMGVCAAKPNHHARHGRPQKNRVYRSYTDVIAVEVVQVPADHQLEDHAVALRHAALLLSETSMTTHEDDTIEHDSSREEINTDIAIGIKDKRQPRISEDIVC